MFYGLISSQTVNIPTQLYPNVVTPYDPLASNKTPKQTVNKKTRVDSNEEVKLYFLVTLKIILRKF